MYELLYTSVCPRGMNESELKVLLEGSRIKNHNLGVTGMLIYCDHEFIQLLEGEEAVVKKLYQIIWEDSRHRSVEVFYEGTIENKAFTDWSMAFKTIDQSELSALMMGYEEDTLGRSPINIIQR